MSKKRYFGLYTTIVLVVVISYLFVIVKDEVWVPRSLPYFELPIIQMERGGAPRVLRRADIVRRWTLINFWASWCQICAEEEPLLNAFAEEGLVQVVGIASEDAEENLRATGKLAGRRYDIALDTTSELLRALRLSGLPNTILVNPMGEIVKVFKGKLDEQAVMQIRDLVEKSEAI